MHINIHIYLPRIYTYVPTYLFTCINTDPHTYILAHIYSTHADRHLCVHALRI